MIQALGNVDNERVVTGRHVQRNELEVRIFQSAVGISC